MLMRDESVGSALLPCVSSEASVTAAVCSDEGPEKRLGAVR